MSPVLDLYSKRKRRALQSDTPEVYEYDDLPEQLRVQITKIWKDAIGRCDFHRAYEAYNPETTRSWEFLHDAIAREKGLHSLADGRSYRDRCIAYLLRQADVDACLDIVELSFRMIDRLGRKSRFHDMSRSGVVQAPDDAIDELNTRFREAGVGYQYANGEIIRVDSQLIHSEVTKPALQLLSDPRFAGAQEEFLSAHAHYRAGETKDCAVDALNALESTMKAICDAQGWEYRKGSRASDLLKLLRSKGLLPDYLDQSFDQLLATLNSGLPKVRNEGGAHGQGGEPQEVPSYVAAYALHLAAAKIVFLVEAFRATEKRA